MFNRPSCNWCDQIPCVCTPPTEEEKERGKVMAAKVYQGEGCKPVRINDIICKWGTEKQELVDESVIIDITEEGALCSRITTADNKPLIWQGDYRRVCSAIGEYDTSIK